MITPSISYPHWNDFVRYSASNDCSRRLQGDRRVNTLNWFQDTYEARVDVAFRLFLSGKTIVFRHDDVSSLRATFSRLIGFSI